MNVLFDADSMIYAACYDSDNKEFYNDVRLAAQKYDHIYKILVDNLVKLSYDLNRPWSLESITVFNGSKGNFRNYIGKKKYKANRKIKHIPLILNELHDYVADKYSSVRGYGVETDDMVAKAWKQISDEEGSENVMIVSIDKDYKQLPCILYNYYYIEPRLSYLTKDQALYNFYEQMISGDQADNVNYIFGKGPKFCKKYFADCKSEYQYIKKTFLVFKERYKSKAREKYGECYNLLRLKTE